ncbi:MAG: aminoacyl-tRNA hydrolase [Alphaproteobacteria bacterium]|nr:aminoacyl-tRNA hydrolase [Rhodobiaceae bacterium]MBO6543682.1 aminoacyl-tRNA hydrolase [Alphaproteobacteria bacterium]MBO6627245.1 aminoacyl-tRNA hydrolase [Alphaproteobacteria bacterium]MDF1626577.1 aminoacyl-tRNA hydrolase [Parvibaculaceae bacterium]|tara:strand:- start:186 stop:818 length:633 start_codon:yes stop_codon:yes gene_type:complete
MILLVGLGNPGDKYARQRHNIGFMAVDEIIRRHSFAPLRSRFQGLATEGTIDGQKVLLLKPQTYMNLSGQSVGEAMRFYKLTPADVVVIHDELDLPAAKVRVKTGGGAAGNNGIRSITEHIGANFRRVRLGIGHPGDRARVTSHVLGDFSKADKTWLDPLLEAIADCVPLLAEGKDATFANKVHLLLNPEAEKEQKKKKAARPAEDENKN